jgi:signal transduction histidine kinase
MVELGLNAVRFAKSQAHLTLEASTAGLLIRFQDDGPGFPEGFDVDSPSTTNGLGVSLPIASAIARGHGGELTAKTHKGGRVELRVAAV